MEPVLMAENLTKVYKRTGQPDFTAVDHISFAVQPGECLGIIGESGSYADQYAQAYGFSFMENAE